MLFQNLQNNSFRLSVDSSMCPEKFDSMRQRKTYNTFWESVKFHSLEGDLAEPGFVGAGGGSTASDYKNSQTSPVSLTDLKIDHEFIDGATYSQACVIMKGSENYTLTGEACETTAKFLCMKNCNYVI